MGLSNRVLDGVDIPHGKGQFLAVVLPKCICVKMDQSVFNNAIGTTCDSAVRQNI